MNNCGTIFLCGGGKAEQTEVIHQHLAANIKKEKPVLYIPLAGNPKSRPYEECWEYAYQLLRRAGIEKTTMWTDIRNRSLQDLQQFSAVYFSGGDSLDLLKKVEEARFAKVLRSYFYNGGILYGQSAGAIIFGSWISRLEDHYSGVNLIKNMEIHCHYRQEEDPFLFRRVNRNGFPVLAIPEGTAVTLHGKRWSVVGERTAYVFNLCGEKEQVMR
ncbi:Type 1 glutamine amidotransferase-like domain-containing protein [Halobacillus andaensis]|uniref:Type 1 glutamine amidotransferase-like domain-containing protein n=1 Tax=Halobacillus andaensis TaxID=1176239 RepID=UPI003D762E56